MPAKMPRPRKPRASRRIASTPTTMEYTKTTTSTPASRTVLSDVPKVEVAQSLTASGVRSIAASPTAITGDAAGTVKPASNCPMPIAAAAATSPHAAPHHRLKPVLEVMPYGPSPSQKRYARSPREVVMQSRGRGPTGLHGHGTRRVQHAPVRDDCDRLTTGTKRT